MTIVIALLAWPVIAAVLFARFDRDTALVWTIVGGLMFLPEVGGINPPLLPNYDKQLAPALAALVFCILTERSSRSAPPLAGWLPANPVAVVLILALVFVSPVLTSVTNAAPLVFGPRVLPGMGLYDIGSIARGMALMLLPLLLGRRYLSTDAAHAALLRCLVLGALAYTVIILVELRLSPQFHNWIYGAHPREFVHSLRGGGFRPFGFFAFGVPLGMFIAAALIGAVALWRVSAGRLRAFYAVSSGWLVVLLVLTKSLGPLMLGLSAATAFRLIGARMVMIGVAVVVTILLSIPVLRVWGVDGPVETIAGIARAIDPDRAGSFLARASYEDAMLERVREKQAFGYGIWGRWRVYDPVTGADRTASDSEWMQIFGQYGWLGYVCIFGLMALPVYLAALRRRSRGLTTTTVGLCVILTIFLADLIANTGLPLLHWLVVGAVLGRIERAPEEAKAGRPAVGPIARPRPVIGALTPARTAL